MVDLGLPLQWKLILFALMIKPFYQIQTLQTLVKFRFAQIKEIITKEFLLVHLMLFIPFPLQHHSL